MSNTDITTAVASSFMEVSFAKGAISNSRADKAVASNIEIDAHVLEAGLVRVYKSIFSGEIGKLHRAMTTAQGKCYTLYLARTMPYNDAGEGRPNRGQRIIPVATAMQFQADMAALEAEFQMTVTALAQAIDDPMHRQRAVAALGTLGDASLLPTGQDVIDKCYVEVGLTALPDVQNYGALSLPLDFLGQLMDQAETKAQRATDKAVGDVTNRIGTELARIVKSTSDLIAAHKGEWQGARAPKVYDSLRTNIQSLGIMLRGTGEGLGRRDLIDLADEVIDNLTQYDTKELRNSHQLAADLNAKAQEIQRKLNPMPETLPHPADNPVPVAPAAEPEPKQDPEPSIVGMDFDNFTF